MLELEGELGVLYQNGQQVAGVYNWHSRLILDYTVKDNVRDYKPHKILSARSYWLVKPIEENVFDAEFHQAINGELVCMEAGKVRIDFPDQYTLLRRLHAPVEITWVSYAE